MTKVYRSTQDYSKTPKTCVLWLTQDCSKTTTDLKDYGVQVEQRLVFEVMTGCGEFLGYAQVDQDLLWPVVRGQDQFLE